MLRGLFGNFIFACIARMLGGNHLNNLNVGALGGGLCEKARLPQSGEIKA